MMLRRSQLSTSLMWKKEGKATSRKERKKSKLKAIKTKPQRANPFLND